MCIKIVVYYALALVPCMHVNGATIKQFTLCTRNAVECTMYTCTDEQYARQCCTLCWLLWHYMLAVYRVCM
jgi:hypothetical protein